MLLGGALVRHRPQLRAIWSDRRDALRLVLFSVGGLMTCQYTYLAAIRYSNSATATVLQYMGQALILLWVCLRARRLPTRREGIALVLALLGAFLLATHGSLTGLAVSPAALVSGIVSACCVAIYTMWPKKLQEQYPTPMLQGWAFLMGGIMFSLIFRPWQIDYVPTAMGVFGIFIVVVLGNVLAFSLYMSGVPLIGPQKASLYSFAEPVTAAIISTLVLGSPFTLWDALGFGCIFLMLVLLSLPAKQKN